MADPTPTPPSRPTGADVLEQQFLEMRWRALSLAADLDRIDRAPGGAETLRTHPRAQLLRKAFELLLSADGSDRAERLQMVLSDTSAPPPK